MVFQEDGDSNNNGGSDRTGFSLKKMKPNKIPQRGLGIAALERLRREDQQRRISAGDSVIPTAPCLPVSDLSSKSPFARNSLQNECSSNCYSVYPLLPRKAQQEHQKRSLVIRNFPSSLPLSSGSNIQIEPPSNQSYISINPPSMTEEQKLTCFKRSWPVQPGSVDHKRIALSRDDATSLGFPHAIVRAEGEAAKLDGSLLSLGLLPVSEPRSIQTVPFQKHRPLILQQIPAHKNAEGKVSEAVDPPTLYNFMGLPRDVMEANPSGADAESKDGG